MTEIDPAIVEVAAMAWAHAFGNGNSPRECILAALQTAAPLLVNGEREAHIAEVAVADATTLIQAERARQLLEEGWTAEHDDQHDSGEMLRAAVLYLHHARGGERLTYHDNIPVSWPWAHKWWKPKTPERDLVRAGALCLAEKDRLQRKVEGAYVGHVEHKLALIIETLAAVRLVSAIRERGKA